MQAQYTDLLVEVEARLLSRREWLAQILECPGTDKTFAINLHCPDPELQLDIL